MSVWEKAPLHGGFKGWQADALQLLSSTLYHQQVRLSLLVT
jgi:hypothetical protein